MAFSYGFYNSIKGDRKYDSVQISHLFDGLILDGVYEHVGERFFVRPSENGLAVIVGTGRAWLLHTWNLNDSDLLLELEPADILLERIDSVILDVNNLESSRTNELKILTGTPSAEPQPPTLINENNHKQYAIANIIVPPEAVEIGQDVITYLVGQEPLPYVMGVLEKHDISQIVAQWEAQWDTWLNEKTTDHDNWEQEHRDEFEYWFTQNQNMFVQWFYTIEGQLSEDAAGNLYLGIQALSQTTFEQAYGMENKRTAINTDELGRVVITESYLKPTVYPNIPDGGGLEQQPVEPLMNVISLPRIIIVTVIDTDINGDTLITSELRTNDGSIRDYLTFIKTISIGSNIGGGTLIKEDYTIELRDDLGHDMDVS